MKFIYQATNQIGEVIKGELDAPNKEYVFNWLTKKELTPVNIKLLEEGGKKISLGMTFGGRLSVLDKILFVKRLSAILKAGIPIVEGFEILIRDTEKPYFKKMLIDIKSIMERGETLASAFASYPKDFSPVFIGLVEAGENSGTLDKNLEQLATQLRKEQQFTGSIKSAMIYPVILIITALVIVIIMITFVLPKITVAFEQSGVELPWVTKLMLAAGEMLSRSPLTALVLIFGFLFLIAFLTFFAPAPIRKIRGKILLKLPVISPLIKHMALARFSSILSSLYMSGLPAIEALSITATSVGNDDYETVIIEARDNVKKGLSIADSLKKRTGLFPNMFISMIAVGEKTGALDEILKTLAEFYEAEVDRLLKNVLALLEPMMLLAMGLGIGLMAVSILMPIYKMVSGFA